MSKAFLRHTLNLILLLCCVPLLGISISELRQYFGLKPLAVEVAGTGSMYPSLFWEEIDKAGVEEYRSTPLMYRVYPGFNLFGRSYLQTSFNYGDMVAFYSDKTKQILVEEGRNPEAGFIKRIVGMSGDTIELRDGYVYRNGSLIDEPYIRTPRSTYGGSFLPDCKVVTVPENSYFVLGDNRKVSADSRSDLGFVSHSSIAYVLPFAKQNLYKPFWRDTSHDAELLGTPTLSETEFYQYFPSLKGNAKLATSAKLRAQALLKDSNTNYSLKNSIRDSGYKNIIFGEFVSYGRFDAEELYQNLTSYHQTAKELKNPNYDDIGLSAVNGEVDGCPTQIIVGHLGGYIPATYTDEEISSWQKSKENLDSVIPSWEQALSYQGIDQNKVNSLLSLLNARRSLVEEVIVVMNKREWISDGLADKIKQDEINSAQAEKLAKELNGE